MRRLPTLLILALCAVAVSVAGVAVAATKQPKQAPRVAAVSPLSLGIGDTLTIRGTNFLPGKLRNWVVFQRERAHAVFVRADSASKTQIKIVVPEKLRPFLSLKEGAPAPTKFRIRVLSTTFGKEFTALKLSPTIGPSKLGSGPPPAVIEEDCDKDKIKNKSDSDDDNDLVPDTREKNLRTDPCRADSDGDGVEDYFEIESAIDLNFRPANFYPVKKPYPNPLFADADTDFDGDGLTLSEENSAWVRYGGRKAERNYSDGCQDTHNPLSDSDSDPTGYCNEGDGQRAKPPPAMYYWVHLSNDDQFTDDEKDVDGDGLTNWDETHGRMVFDWWTATYEQEKPYRPQYGSVDFLDYDSDGDGRWDGEDDQDYDGVQNRREVTRDDVPAFDGNIPGVGGKAEQRSEPAHGKVWMQPYNPCLPDVKSRTCSRHPPFKDAWPPFGDSAPSPAIFVPGDQPGHPWFSLDIPPPPAP